MSSRLSIAWLLLTTLSGCTMINLLPAGAKESKFASAELCRADFPDVAVNPGVAGGGYLDPESGRLCLYGTLENLQLDDLTDELLKLDETPLRMVVRSVGGPVDVWLALAETLGPLKPELIIDEACFSSCAVYAAPIARNISFVTTGLLAWHGGPNHSTAAINFGEEHPDYKDLADRTEGLYEAHGVSTLLLADTMRIPTREQLALVKRYAPNAVTISGYAISPQTLQLCYGLIAAKGLQHPGGDLDVLLNSNSLATRLALLEYPGTVQRCRY